MRRKRPGRARAAWSRAASLLLAGACLVWVGKAGGQVAGGTLAGARFHIRGVVVNGGTGDPVARCELTATRVEPSRAARAGAAGPGQELPPVETDARGRFEIQVPQAGPWRLMARARGFHSQAYDEHQGFSSAVVVNETDPSIDLTFKLLPNAAVEGFVLDEAGEPVRGGQLSLVSVPAAAPDGQRPARQPRGNAMTDDRGHYEFANIGPGEYTISVRAQPWYAVAARPAQMLGGTTPDPATATLDVVYPTTWYPGTADFNAATPVTLQAGDRRQADFRLMPVPGYHLRIPAPTDRASVNGDDVAPAGFQPIQSVAEISPDGTQQLVSVTMSQSRPGDWEMDGLAPGTYEIHRRSGTGGEEESSLLEIGAQGPRTLDLGAAAQMARVHVTLEGANDTDKVQVNLIDAATRRPYAVPTARGGDKAGGAAERVAQVAPGRYEVVLNNTGGLRLAGVTATGAEATGRMVTLHAGPASVVLHVANGRGSVGGVAKRNGTPVEGAMLLLVPATLGDPSGLTTLRRGQSNTDGSFRMEEVLPGAYILLAIDRGWSINWNDPATLSRYLIHGVAVDLSRAQDLKMDVAAQEP
jgi:hypothetical protein